MGSAKGSVPGSSPPNDICEVFGFDADKVSRLKDKVDQTKGLAALFKAFADDTRVKIILALAHEELCVCEVAKIIGSSAATASHHLRHLHGLGLARYRKEGKFVYYSLDDHHVANIITNALEHFREGRR